MLLRFICFVDTNMQFHLRDPMSLFNEMADLLHELAKTTDVMCTGYAIVCVLGKKAQECNRLHSEMLAQTCLNWKTKRMNY